MIGRLPKLTLWQLGEVPIRADISLLILPIFVLFILPGRGSADVLPFAVALILVIVVTLVLHEMGHALAAKHYKLGIKEIVIGGLWGYVSLKRQTIPRVWYIVVLIAGPLVNLVAFLVLSVVLATPGTVSSLPILSDYTSGGFPQWFLSTLKLFTFINLITFVGNMLPIYPMDGGRIVHQLLGWYLSPQFSMQVTSAIGILTCAVCIYLGSDYGTIWIAFFLVMIYFNLRILVSNLMKRPFRKT